MADTYLIRAEPLGAAIRELVRGFGSEEGEVELVTDNLIQANLTGHDSHGIGMLPRYSEAWVEGGLKANAHIKLLMDGGALLRLDGQAGDFRAHIGGEGGATTAAEVQAVVVSTGFEHFDASRDPRYEYGRAPNVIGIHELEGMLTDGKVVRHDGRTPKKMAFVFCVGSRDRATNSWCCTICCGVSIKQAMEVKELLKDVEIYMIYIDIRTFGLWENLYWNSMEQHGINYIRGRVSQVFDTGSQLLIKGEDTLVRGPFEVLMDMVVLSVGVDPGEGTAQAAKAIGLATNPFGFLQPKHPNVHFDSAREGIYLAGACVAPMSIEEALAGGSAAAMQAAKLVLARAAA